MTISVYHNSLVFLVIVINFQLIIIILDSSISSYVLLWSSFCLLLLLPVDGNGDTLIATAAATIKVYLQILINNGTLDGNPILSFELLVLHHFDPFILDDSKSTSGGLEAPEG